MNSELFACQFCKEFFSIQREPFLLPDCGHSVCELCLKAKLSQLHGFICKEDGVAVTRTSISEFPKNFALLQIIKSRQKLVPQKFAEDHDSSSNSEKNYITSDNTIRNVLPSDQENDVERCPQHKKKLEIMCLDHKVKICATCALFGDHKNHQVINLKDLLPSIVKRIEALEKMNQDLTQRASEVFETSQYYNKIEMHFQMAAQNQYQQIDAFFDDLIKKINIRRLKIKQDAQEKINHMHEIYNKNVQEILLEVQRKVELWKMTSQSKLKYYQESKQQNTIPVELINVSSTSELMQIGDRYFKELEQSRNHIINRLEDPQIREFYVEFKSDFESFLSSNLTLHQRDSSFRMENSMSRLDQITECSLLKDMNNSVIQDPLNQNQMEQWIQQYQEMQKLKQLEIENNNNNNNNNNIYQNEFVDDNVQSVLKKSASSNMIRKVSPSPMRKSNNQKKISDKFQPLIQKIREDAVEQADFSQAEMGDDGLLSLKLILLRTHNLKSLKLAKNKIQDAGASIFLRELFEKWEDSDCQIQTVNLSSNLLTDKIIDKIYELCILKQLQFRQIVPEHPDGQTSVSDAEHHQQFKSEEEDRRDQEDFTAFQSHNLIISYCMSKIMFRFSAYKHLLFQSKGKVAFIQLNRPKSLNALCDELIQELNTLTQEIDGDKQHGAIVITGNEKAFAAGADIKEMKDRTYPEVYNIQMLASWENLTQIKKPIIAAVNGYALGGGFELALMCDIIVAGQKAKFGLPEITLGTLPGCGGTQRLIRAVGKSKAMQMTLTGEFIDATAALNYGLVSSVFAPENVVEEAVKIGEKISTFSKPIAALIKESINAAENMGLREGVRFEKKMFYQTFATEDRKEGMTAFTEKRAPIFKDQ